ncbi:MAG TPA: cytochrome P450 [Acidimicrobiales bacterium]|nr:cytochrome P450 [Acidimicrobiales bacterium]
MTVDVGLREPPQVSGGDAEHGHLDELRVDPIGLMRRTRQECGDVGQFRLADRDVVLLTGAEANEMFFRAPEEQLDQAEAYPFMTPIFGEGVVFDAPPERRREMLHNQALRDKFMRGHAATIADEVEGMVKPWSTGEGGTIDLLDWFAELTIYTSSACLIGSKFRHELDRRFAELYHDLEQGTDAIAYVDPYADIDSFRRRDAARLALVDLVQGIMDRRSAGPPVTDDDRDLLDVLMSIREEDDTPKFSTDIVTGMFISMMFAGHHTTSGTAAWTLIELLRHPGELEAVRAELDELYTHGEEVSYQALRAMPRLESAIKEALRLHPPLILVLRVVKEELEVEGFRIAPGKLVGASPAVSNRIAEDFPDPDAFVPERYVEPRAEDRTNPWTWIPFGAGRHRCVGAPFAMMQLKAIFSVLLRHWDFELAQPADTYRNDHSKMVVQLAQPCVARYRSRAATP